MPPGSIRALAVVMVSRLSTWRARCGVQDGVLASEGAIIGAGSVVTRDVEPWTLVAGNPARLKGRLDPTTGRKL